MEQLKINRMNIYHSIYKLGDFVYLISDPDQKKWMIINVIFRINNSMSYGLQCGTNDYTAYEQEITLDKNILI